MTAHPCQYHARLDSPTRPPRDCPDLAEFTYEVAARTPFEVCRRHALLLASVERLREMLDPLPGYAALDAPAQAC